MSASLVWPCLLQYMVYIAAAVAAVWLEGMLSSELF